MRKLALKIIERSLKMAKVRNPIAATKIIKEHEEMNTYKKEKFSNPYCSIVLS